jgi:hypothetical protein
MSASGTGLLAVDRGFVIYLVLTGILAIAGGGAIGFSLAFAHGVAGLLVFRLSKRPLPRNGALRCLRLAYPVAATPFLLYPELRFLNHVITDRLFDGMVQGWELTLFGSQLSMTFHEWLPDFTISELLHLGYMSYYILVPIALIGVFVTRGDAALHRAAFATAVAFLLSYLLFTLFPVAGPRYDFPRIEGEVADGVFFQIVHTILETGSSRGTAFPSSHIVGTVYGRFHYGVDALGGLVLMVIIWRAAPGLSERFGPLGSAPQKRPPDRQPDRPPGYQTG